MQANATPDPARLRERALRLLARREYSRADLERKLDLAGYAAGDIAALLDRFEERGWLSDRRFAESWVADHRAKSGSVKLACELRQHGVADAIIEAVLDGARDSELERAQRVWRKKFAAPPADAAERARQIRFLQGRGFPLDIVRRAMAGQDDC